jgi:AcrR family transcriptional regulator
MTQASGPTRDSAGSAAANPGPAALPRGRHKLPREQVVRSQRDRLLRAMAEAMAEKGYVETSVADVLRRARISRETFYQQFSSKQDCFIAAFDAAAGTILGRAASAAGQSGGPLERFDRALRAYLDALAAEPELARLFLLEVYAAGEPALQRRGEVQGRFADLVAAGVGARNDGERFACDTLVAAISAMVTARLAAGDPEGLRALHEPLVALVERALGRR